MQVSSHWRTASLVAGALLIGSVIGAPLAQAVSASLVRIEGGGTANLAAVNKSGQLESALASPAQTVIAFSGSPTNCSAGFYTIPAGKALIITSVTFQDFRTISGSPQQLILGAGPPATPCLFGLAISAAPSSEETVTQNQVFTQGIAVPAGDALGLSQSNDSGRVVVYGYLVPASAVPPGILMHTRAERGLLAIKPRQ